MKQLTTDQINHIDYVLRNDYSFEDFEDLRIELLDHIASDVEILMEENAITFDEALLMVLDKWNDEISCDKSSFYNSVPKIVGTLWKKLDWKYNICVLPLTAVLSFGSIYLNKEVWVTYAMYFIASIGLVLGSYLLILFRKNQFNTVLSKYAKNKIMLYVGLFLLTLVISIEENYSDGDLLSSPSLFFILHPTLVFAVRIIIMRKNIKIKNQLLKMV